MAETENYNIISSNEPPAGYFEDEVREGFFVTSMMKRYWAAQLTVLAEIEKICKKHDIAWFADCGTLLGAVRHGGFIPWDDDLDICMLRSDWIRFFDVAPKELSAEYCVLNLNLEKDYDQMIGRIVNAHAINTGEEHLKNFHGCPYTVGIDVFPLDYLCNDEEKEEERRQKAASITNEVNKTQKNGRRRELMLALEKQYMFFPEDGAKDVALMPFWVSDKNHKYSRTLFEKAVWLPFEYTSIPVPAGYNEVLRIEYGNYMTVHKGGGIHDYPVYRDQEKILEEKSGVKPYRYTPEKAVPSAVTKEKQLKEKCFEIIETLMQAGQKTEMLISTGNNDLSQQMLTACQSLAITLGTMLETNVSGSEGVVHLLEDYCEKVYVLSNMISNSDAVRVQPEPCEDVYDSKNLISDDDTVCRQQEYTEEASGINPVAMTEEIREKTEELFAVRKKEVLFLLCRAAWWDSIKSVYEKYVNMPDTEVFTMVLTYQTGDRLTGKDGGVHCDLDLASDFSEIYTDPRVVGVRSSEQSVNHLLTLKSFTENVRLVTPEEYDISSRHPDVIVTQYPYDDCSMTMDVPAFFYSRNLAAKTEELVYVPCFDMDPPIDDNDKAIEAIKVLVEQPAVFSADRVILKNEKMRDFYIKVLTGITGDEEYWQERICILK